MATLRRMPRRTAPSLRLLERRQRENDPESSASISRVPMPATDAADLPRARDRDPSLRKNPTKVAGAYAPGDRGTPADSDVPENRAVIKRPVRLRRITSTARPEFAPTHRRPGMRRDEPN
jgi:hypothetical protein